MSGLTSYNVNTARSVLQSSDEEFLLSDSSLTGGSCEYYTVNSFCDLSGNVSDFYKYFTINFNIRSFHANFSSFEALLHSFPKLPSFIFLTETWNSPLNVNLCSIDNYNGFHSFRDANSHGGGVSIFCQDSFSCEKVFELCFFDENIETCVVKIQLLNRQLILICIYRPPRGMVPVFLEKVEQLLNSELVQNAKNVLVGGDMNLNLLNLDSSIVRDYVSCMRSHRFIPTISCATRFPPNSDSGISPSLLDHLWYDSLSNFHSGTIDIDISDHCPTFLLFNSDFDEPSENVKKKIQFRLKNKECIDKFHTELQTMNWNFPNLENFIEKLNQYIVGTFLLKLNLLHRKDCKNLG